MNYTGGPAFPTYESNGDGHIYGTSSGIDIRDYFAAKAMQARINAAWTEPGPSKTAFKEWHEGLPPDSLIGDFHDYLALAAYQMADAMIKARDA